MDPLDLTGLKCPLPALATRKALRRLPAGGTLVVVATDPLAGIDIPNAAREEGCGVDDQDMVDGAFRFTLSRRA
jgi:tRNA 2-thiouridine synthesizing protein A